MRMLALIVTGSGLGVCLGQALRARDWFSVGGVIVANAGVLLYIYVRDAERAR